MIILHILIPPMTDN